MSTGPQGMLLTQGETTAAQRTFSVYLTDAAGDAIEDVGDLALTLSKAGAAFAAAAGSITQKVAKGGWYDVVLATADLSALGDLAYQIAGTNVDTLTGNLQVTLLDHNVATVNPGADGITSSTLAASAATELQAGLATAAAVEAITLATRTVTVQLGTITDEAGDGALNDDGDIIGVSTKDSIDVTIGVTGTWGGASATVQTTQDPTASPVVWTTYVDEAGDNPLSANGEIIVAGGGHVAARVLFASTSGTTDLDIAATVRKPANT